MPRGIDVGAARNVVIDTPDRSPRIGGKRNSIGVVGAAAGTVLSIFGPSVAAQTLSVEQLQSLIQAQQQQIQAQQRTLEALQAEVSAMRQSRPQAGAVATGADPTRPEVPAPASDRLEVTSGEPRVQLAISGQVNRMINVASDGHSTKGYFVDNQNSTSRVRFVGTGRFNPDLTLGSRIEIAVRPNSSNIVSQTNEDAGDSFDQRIVETFLESKRYGRLSLGKGPTAADGAHEVDLSGTDVVAYASISDIAGGLRFRNEGSSVLSGISIANGFTDFDGSRRDRLRYDTPVLSGFTLAGAVISDQRWDAALFWTGQSSVIKAAAAAAVQEPNLPNVDLRYGGSFSVLHQPTGLNFTTSVGSDMRDNKDPYNFYFKLGLLQRYFDIGQTAFSVDYTYGRDALIATPNLRADGHSAGAYVVQKVESYGVDLYGGVRWLTLRTDSSPDLDDIVIGTVGSRVKF